MKFWEISPDIGLKLNGVKINSLAFAHDIVLVTLNKLGLQELLNSTPRALEQVEIEFNASKRHAVSILVSGRNWKNLLGDGYSIVIF